MGVLFNKKKQKKFKINNLTTTNLNSALPLTTLPEHNYFLWPMYINHVISPLGGVSGMSLISQKPTGKIQADDAW